MFDSTPTLSQLNEKHFQEQLSVQLGNERLSPPRDFTRSYIHNEPYRQQQFQASVSRLLKNALFVYPNEKEVYNFIDKFEVNFPNLASTTNHKDIKKTKSTPLAQPPLGWRPDIWGCQVLGAWDSFHLYDMLCFLNFKEAKTLMENKYNSQLYSTSVSTLITLLHDNGVQSYSPTHNGYLHGHALMRRDAGAEHHIEKFYNLLNYRLDLSTAQSHTNFRLLDFLAKTRPYEAAPSSVGTSSFGAAPQIDSIIEQQCALRVGKLYDKLLLATLKTDPTLLVKPNSYNYDYTPIDYALWSENFIFLEKVVQILTQHDDIAAKFPVARLFENKSLQHYQLKNVDSRDKIVSFYEKARLEKFLSPQNSAARAPTPSAVPLVPKKKAHKI